jgi:long-chain acyl-CoA synthetase
MLDTTQLVYSAPPYSGQLRLGHTLPELLDWACDRTPDQQALNQWENNQWQPLSNLEFRRAAEETAYGLKSLGVERGDRVVFLMQSNVAFCLADMGCLLAGLVDVPIDLTQTIENIVFILQQTEAPVLIVANLNLLYQILPYLGPAVRLHHIIVADVPADWQQQRQTLLQAIPQPDQETDQSPTPPSPLEPGQTCLYIPQFLCEVHPELFCPPSALLSSLPCIQVHSLAELRQAGCRYEVTHSEALRAAIVPSDLATIVYIASETKRPKGVMLSHENISANILAAFSSYPNLHTGAEEVALLFLPLTHIFARAFFYGHLAYGHRVYFSDPNHLIRHLKQVEPTIMITVPRLLEKLYERVFEHGQRLGGWRQWLFNWAWQLAHRYSPDRPTTGIAALPWQIADRVVFSQWRAVFGRRLKALISGGAALRPELVRVWSAAGIPIVQGYGLTETSSVLSYTREGYNPVGSVGAPIAGVSLTRATDGEILVKSPFVMQGYYRDPAATQRVLTPEGWLHTGDLGEITPTGVLSITGVKKALFKLVTGKYVSPQPLEQELEQFPLIAQAVTVGANQKFCAMLIFPNLSALRGIAQTWGIEPSGADWLEEPRILALYQRLIDQANCHLPYWSTVRRFQLLDTELTLANGLLQSDGRVARERVFAQFAPQIAVLYRHDPEVALPYSSSAPAGDFPACPTYAQSFTRH